jgi:hypothetical protein
MAGHSITAAGGLVKVFASRLEASEAAGRFGIAARCFGVAARCFLVRTPCFLICTPRFVISTGYFVLSAPCFAVAAPTDFSIVTQGSQTSPWA